MRFWVALLPCPLLAGCLAYVYPETSRTPEVSVFAEDVHAFRVTTEFTMSGPWMTGPIQYTGLVEEIPVAKATVGPQRDAYFAYYYLLFPVVNGSWSRSLEVLLYRPGFESVVIPARRWWLATGSDRPEQVVWKEAPDLLARKATLDLLLATKERRLLTREVMQFAAREYARLANSPLAAVPAMAETRKELLTLAKEYDDLAGKPKP